jgi:hypothetical protein
MSIYNFTVDTNTACMDFNPKNNRYPEELIESSFLREARYLCNLQSYKWAPRQVSVDVGLRKIYFEWFNNTCEDKLSSLWKEQLEEIAKDLHNENIYKPSFYPKYFYVDNNDQMHAFNFYTAFDYNENPVNVEFYRPILNQDRSELIDRLAPNGELQLQDLMYQAFNNYIAWPDNALKDIYKRVYGL